MILGRGFTATSDDELWSRYVAALALYHTHGLVIRTVEEHDEMLLRLSGPLLQLAPGIPEAMLEEASYFGALDQFYNNLRDMTEDAARGLCWLPEDALCKYGIDRDDVIEGTAPERPRWSVFMRTWIYSHESELRLRADRFIGSMLPRALHTMRRWTLRRYARIRNTMRAVNYNYLKFDELYWAEVKRELGTQEVSA